MNGQIIAEGARVRISQDWADYLDQFTDIAGSLLAVFFVLLVLVLAVWLVAAAFTHMGKTQAFKRIIGILTTAALAGCLVSTIGWSIKSSEDGGAGFGSVSVSGGEQADVEVNGHKPKQWSVEDVQGDGDSSAEKKEEETSDPTPTEEPTTEEPTTEPPTSGGTTPPEDAPDCGPGAGAQSDITSAAWGPGCGGE
ncbi:hypothetical protein GCM10028787_31280 [Brachybacterium horti]